MRNNTGVSVVLADSETEVDAILVKLGVSHAYPLSQMSGEALNDPDPVFFAVLATQAKMDRLVQMLSVRRGITSVAGKRNFVGFNVDWMGKLMAERDLDKAIAEVTKAPAQVTMPKPVLVVPSDEERDDPYADLGYRR